MNIFNPSIPQGPDLPQQSQSGFLSNFGILNNVYSVNHVPFANIVSNAISNGVVTDITSTNHLLTNGATVVFETVQGELNGEKETWAINGTPLVVTVIDDNHFSVPYDSSTNFPYIPLSGSYYVTSTFPYGYHTQISLASPLPTQNPTLSSQAIAYSNLDVTGLIANLLFKNGTTTSFEKQLTGLVTTTGVGTGRGFKTPWGLIMNMGQIRVQTGATVHTFPVPFTSTPQMIQLTQGKIKQNLLERVSAVTSTNFTVTVSTTVGTGPDTDNPWYLAIGV